MQISSRNGILILIGFFVALLIGAGALFTLLAPAVQSLSRSHVSVAPPPTRGASIQTTRTTPASTPATATPTPVPDVMLSLASVDRQPSQGGVTVTIDVSNHRSSTLDFTFDPTYDVQLQDNRGDTWALRWAEYQGTPSVAAGSTNQLTRAFFAGPVADNAVWPLTLFVERVPGVGKTSWKIGKTGPVPTLASVEKLPAPPIITAAGPISLNADNPEVNSGLSGVQVDLVIDNHQNNDLVFDFDPNTQITAQDNLGRPYHVAWAQYSGVVHVGPHTSNRLARAFFTGPVSDAKATWLTISLQQVPGANSLKTNVSLD
ncbi:MAG TPA: hypothetical protein VKX96_09595 [Chloroflexota bacterium]|nr:hypothetical protein [Chloroflexota bacterium]